MLVAGVSWVITAWSGAMGQWWRGCWMSVTRAGGGVVAGADEAPDTLGERGCCGDLGGWVAAVGEVEA